MGVNWAIAETIDHEGITEVMLFEDEDKAIEYGRTRANEYYATHNEYIRSLKDRRLYTGKLEITTHYWLCGPLVSGTSLELVKEIKHSEEAEK